MGRDAVVSRPALSHALDAVAKAQAAVQALAGNFDGWMADEVTKLDAAREGLDRGVTIEAVSGLYMRAHDLKGLAPTFGYPIVHELAASLCYLIDNDGAPFEERLPLIDDHIDAIRTLVCKQVRTAADPLARQLVAHLAKDVQQILEDAAAKA